MWPQLGLEQSNYVVNLAFIWKSGSQMKKLVHLKPALTRSVGNFTQALFATVKHPSETFQID